VCALVVLFVAVPLGWFFSVGLKFKAQGKLNFFQLAQMSEHNKEPEISVPFLAKQISDLRVFDLVGRTRPVHCVNASDTVEQVVHFLQAYQISSAPIVVSKLVFVFHFFFLSKHSKGWQWFAYWLD
jgi:hypothetical protein